MSKVTCEKPKNSEYIIHSPGVPHDSFFMAFPMRQDSMWVSSIWCSHCIPARGDHPQEVKYCSVATSHSPAHRVNCGWTAGQCYLSLRPDHRDSALSRLRRRRAGICSPERAEVLRTCFDLDRTGRAPLEQLQLPTALSQDDAFLFFDIGHEAEHYGKEAAENEC